MNLERQRQILKETHGLVLYEFVEQLGQSVKEVQQVVGPPSHVDGAPSFWMRSRIYATRNEVRVWFPARTGIRSRSLHNFVAAVTYAKAELTRVTRPVAAKENQ